MLWSSFASREDPSDDSDTASDQARYRARSKRDSKDGRGGNVWYHSLFDSSAKTTPSRRNISPSARSRKSRRRERHAGGLLKQRASRRWGLVRIHIFIDGFIFLFSNHRILDVPGGPIVALRIQLFLSPHLPPRAVQQCEKYQPTHRCPRCVVYPKESHFQAPPSPTAAGAARPPSPPCTRTATS